MRSRVTPLIALAALLAASSPAGAQAPSLSVDTLFAPPSGIAKTDFGSSATNRDVPQAVAVSGDRIYTVGVTGTGDSQDVAISKRRLDGTLDNEFSPDHDGKLTLSVGAEADIGTGMTVLPNGSLRIIVATDLSAASDDFFDVAVVGLTAEGLPDATFGDLSGGVRRKILAPGTNRDVPTHIEPGPDGRLVIVGSRSDGTRDDLFVAMLEANGAPVTSSAPGGFDSNGIRFTPTPSESDQGVDVVFRPDGGVVVWTSTDPTTAANDAAGVLRAFNADGTPDTAFGTGGKLEVASNDTIPGGLIVRDGRLWVSGATQVGSDTDAFIARVNLDGSGQPQVRRFDMRGFLPAGQAVLSESHDLTVLPGSPETLVAVGAVTYTVTGQSQSFTDWAAAAFTGLDGDLAALATGDVVIPAPGNGELLSAAGAPGWAAVTGTYVPENTTDNSFGNARLLLDADKVCDLAVSVAEPGEIVVKGSSPAALTVRVQNVGARACAGTVSVAAPYAMTAVGTGVVAPGATFTAAALPLTYHGPRRADDVLTIQLDAGDPNQANNRAFAHVVFSYCDLAVQPVGGAGAIPTEGTRRFEVTLRNRGTATCRVRLGSKEPYRLARGKTASDAVAVAAPAGARPGKRVPVVVRASAADDVDLRNNAVTVSPEVVRVGDSDVVSLSARRIAGTARRGAGDIAASRLRPVRVDVAVVRKGGRRCSLLSSKNGTFDTVARNRDGECRRLRWLRADGTATWDLTLSGRLAPGSYIAYSRATIRAGFPEARFSGKDRNRVEFTVH